jgi:F0F1-type ATP synthase membrane subunit b/b'
MAAVVVGLSVLGGCATATQLCDEAAVLADGGALGRATETYARADRAGEGDCAAAGLAAAGSRYAAGYVDVALGRAAEDVQDVAGATLAYQAALAHDDGNLAAREGLARLGQPVPELRGPDPKPVVQAPGEPQTGLIVGVSVAATASACVLLALLGWALWWWFGRAARLKKALNDAERMDKVLADLAAAGDDLKQAQAKFEKAAAGAERARRAAENNRVDDLAGTRTQLLREFVAVRTGIEEAVQGLRNAADRRSAALRLHLDDLADYLGDRVGDPQPVRETFRRPGAARGGDVQ